MEANEFRLGNIIRTVGGVLPYWQIYEEDMMHIFSNFDTGNYNSYEPIPLTEEWLLKFGFEKIGGWDDYEGYIKDEVEIALNEKYPFENYLQKELKHVHQLQNLYFALTGKELTIKQ